MRNLCLFVGFILLVACEHNHKPTLHEQAVNFIVISDMGHRGESEQQHIANHMAHQVETSQIDFIAVAGDPIHDYGVKSIDDKEWELKFEHVYNAKSLQKIPFYVVSGNHEYMGSVQAMLDYSNKSERWNAPDRYFSLERYVGNNNDKALWVFIDTTPLIDKLFESKTYSDAGQQNRERQLYWLDSTLYVSTCTWKFVIGHHPIYAFTDKDESERTDMQERVGQILEKNNVDFYISGHIHNFQYIKQEGKSVNYIVNSSASLSRKVQSLKETVFCSSDPGYSVFSVSNGNVTFSFVNHKGHVVYRKRIEKK